MQINLLTTALEQTGDDNTSTLASFPERYDRSECTGVQTDDPLVSAIYCSAVSADVQVCIGEVQSEMVIDHYTKPVELQQIFDNLLEQVQPVDFRMRAEMQSGETLKSQHYQVVVVEEVQALIERSPWRIIWRTGTALIYNGAYWQPLDDQDLRRLLRFAAEKTGVKKTDARWHRFADQLFRQYVELARFPAPDVSPDTVLVNLKNGTFEITPDRQRLRPADPKDLLRYQLPFAYEPVATAPRFEQFLQRVLPDTCCQQLLAEYIGYLFVRSSRLKLEKALFLYGSGANGKSVFFEIINALLGSRNTTSYSLQSLTDERGYHRAKLTNVLVNYTSEISSRLDVNMFKQLTSGEPIEARLPYGEPFMLTDYAKLIFNGNELPKGVENSPAFFRRLIIVPFQVTIPVAEQDPQLANRIVEEELSGVFNWVLNGLKRLLRQGRFTTSALVQQQVDTYQLESDTVRLFVNEYGYVKSSGTCIQAEELYRRYSVFCQDEGSRQLPKKAFLNWFRRERFHVERKSGGMSVGVSTQMQTKKVISAIHGIHEVHTLPAEM